MAVFVAAVSALIFAMRDYRLLGAGAYVLGAAASAGAEFTGPKMTAIVAYVLGEHWTDPEIQWMSVSSDGYITTDADFIGDAADFDRNLRKLLIAAQLSPEEREVFSRLFRERVDDHRPAPNRPDYAELLH